MKMNRFNIRVYGILIQKDAVLLSEETVLGKRVVKFPGGGLEFGEGLIAGLKREWKEELNTEIEVKEHFYTTDFYVESFLGDGSQIISIYYLVEIDEDLDLERLTGLEGERGETHKWQLLETLSEKTLSLIIDQKVAEMLKKSFGH